MDQERRPENLLGVVLDAYWTSLANDPLASLLLTGLLALAGVLVVLLGGIALGRAWFGVALVLAYGLGMAATLTGVGLLLAHLRTRMDRRLHLPAGSLPARVGRLLPAVTASVIVLVGLGLAAQGAAQL